MDFYEVEANHIRAFCTSTNGYSISVVPKPALSIMVSDPIECLPYGIKQRLSTAFLEKGDPLRRTTPQHSVSTKGLASCASQPVGPTSLETALVLALTFLKEFFSLEKTPSMGLKSGE